MNGFLETAVRTLLGFSVLLFLTRLIGKKQLGQLNIFTYITGIAIGSMAGEMVIHRDVNLWEGMLSLFIWSALVFAVEIISLKSAKARVLLDGEPTIVIKKGQIVEKALQKQRLNLDDLSMLLRTNEVFSILDVEYAILEPNGDLSVMKKSIKDSVTKEDLAIPVQAGGYLPTEIIVDGLVVYANLRELGFSEHWLADQLKISGVSQRDVLYAELQRDGSLYIQRRG